MLGENVKDQFGENVKILIIVAELQDVCMANKVWRFGKLNSSNFCPIRYIFMCFYMHRTAGWPPCYATVCNTFVSL